MATFTGAAKPTATATNFNGRVQTLYLANETTVTDQAGKVRRSITDGLGRLIRVDEPDASGNLGSSSSPLQPTSYLYDGLGNLLQVNQGSQQRIFTYDTLSRLKTAKNPEQQMVATSYTYDDASNLITRANPNGSSVSFTYDGLNRVQTKTLSTGTWTYNYDTGTNGKGRMVSVVKQGSTDGYYYDGYDAMGRVSASHQVTDSISYAFTYGYDLAGNLTSQQYPSGRVITTSFDPAARLSQVTGQKAGESNKTYASLFQYTPHGGISQMTLGNSTRETMSYNSRLQPLMIELRKTADNSLLLGLDYTYGSTNNNGNVHTQTIRFGATTFSQSYTYDSLNRLETAMETGSWSQTYGYDRWGNRRVLVPQSTGYPIDADLTPTQPTHISTATNRITMPGFDYDTSGNQTAQIRSSQSETLGYDSENRMTSFVSGSTTTSYVYDGDGRRVKKVVGTETTVFVYNAGSQLIAEYSTGQPQGSGTSYLTTDHLGSTRLVTDASGNVKARHDYLPFGEETGAGIGQRTLAMGYGAADSTRQRFTQKERDTESGLDYFLARYYSGAQGRFTSPDEFTGGPDELYYFADDAADNPTFYADLFSPQSLNKYHYALNNPLRFVDPDGHQETAAAALRGFAGGARAGARAIPGAGWVVLGFEALVGFFKAIDDGKPVGDGSCRSCDLNLQGAQKRLEQSENTRHQAKSQDSSSTNSSTQSSNTSGQTGNQGDDDKKPIFGGRGTQTTSTTVYKGKGKERIDVENPNPGKRPGQIHYQDNSGNKYLYDPAKKLFTGASNSLNKKLLNNSGIQRGIQKALKILGESQ